MTPSTTSPSTAGDDTARPEPDGARAPVEPPRRSLSPSVLAYLMGPLALIAILLLMHFDDVAKEPVSLWIAVFIATPLASVIADRIYEKRPSRLSLHTRVAFQAAGLTMVIYLTGWGPVLVGAYAFLALENVSHSGSRVWRVTALWSLLGIAIGQFAVVEGWAPSMLSVSRANALAVMGAFVLVFTIRMAGATMAQKEEAESSMRLSEDRFRSLIQNSSDATLVMDGRGICTFVSPAIYELTGLDPAELIDRYATDFVHPDDRDRVRDRLGQRFQANPGAMLVQFRMGREETEWREVEAVVTNQLDRPSVGGYVANIRDITERKEFEALLAHRALHDPLTGLANRQLILDRAEQMLSRVRRNFDPVAAYFIDLDNFKDANDSLGHDAGDKLLQAVATRFSSILRASDTVGRLGGDEFVFLVEGISLQAGPAVVAERIRDVLKEPFHIEGYDALPITVTASIGIATGVRDTAQELLRDADIALYRAKAAGRNSFVVFEPAMQSAVIDRLELRSDLDAALAKGEYFLLYQPIFDLDGQNIRGVEALIRWRHPVRGIIPPDDFIPLLEDSGAIIDVGRWVLSESCEPGGAVAPPGTPGRHLGQCLHAAARLRPVGLRRRGRLVDQWAGGQLPDARDHRVHPDARRPCHRRPAEGAEGDRRAHRHRRLRHRVLIDGLPPPVPRRHLEDRPLVRCRHERVVRRPRPHPHLGRAGPHPGVGDAGRGDRDDVPAGGVAPGAVRHRPGVPVRPAGRP